MMLTRLNSIVVRLVAPLAVVAGLLAACGGGSSSSNDEGMQAFVQAMATAATTQATATSATLGSDRRVALGVTANASAAITITQLFDWAESQYPTLFTPHQTNQQIPYQGVTYTARAYPVGTGFRYIGVDPNGFVYGLGDFTNNVPQPYGQVSDYNCQVLPSSCVSAPPTNPTTNQCQDPSYALLTTGYKSHLVYSLLPGTAGSYDSTTDTVVDGPGFTFQGQSAVQVTSTTNATIVISQTGFTSTTVTSSTNKSYAQAASGGLVQILGTLSQGTSTNTISIAGQGGSPTTSTTGSTVVFNPPSIDYEFTLTLGQSRTDSTTQTTTITAPKAQAPQTTTNTRTATFEAVESVTVPAGTYQACRYRYVDAASAVTTLNWYLVGKGILLQSQAVNSTTPSIVLKSGTLNGAGF